MENKKKQTFVKCHQLYLYDKSIPNHEGIGYVSVSAILTDYPQLKKDSIYNAISRKPQRPYENNGIKIVPSKLVGIESKIRRDKRLKKAKENGNSRKSNKPESNS